MRSVSILLISLCAFGVSSGYAAPVILSGGVVNAAASAGISAVVAPGSILSIYGSGLASPAPGSGAQASGFPLPTSLGGAQVLMNGIPAPLYYADSAQINAQVPWEVAGASTVAVQVFFGGAASNTQTVALAAVAPGIFIVLHAADYAPLTASRPATPGEFLIIYCTGLGAVSNSPGTGSAASGPLSGTTLTPTVTIGGAAALVLFSGLTPGLAGLYQVNVKVPQAALSGNPVPVVLNFDNTSFTASTPIPYTVPQTLSTFQLPELFGVAWPDQPIEFRYDGGQPPQSTTRMVGPDGQEVPYQWVTSCSDTNATKGCIAVRAGLPANSASTWTLQSGVAPAAAAVHAVRLTQTDSAWELTNGLTGVRIITEGGNPRPWNRAPIQGIQLAGGAWTGADSGPNLLYGEPAGSAGCVGCLLHTPLSSATGYSVSVVDAGPLKVVVKAVYTFNRPRYAYGTTVINSEGQGHYTIVLTLYANSKSVLIDEDSDMQFSYYLPVYAQVQPDLERFRGHDSISAAGSNDPACGYEPPT
ncbi:MAG: hypothetical protein M3N54_10270, partial [Acidobacteriota bacterium]|nr:hypothetical protein [Acidobacteriota bacterium]